MPHRTLRKKGIESVNVRSKSNFSHKKYAMIGLQVAIRFFNTEKDVNL
jgi:hypothetical protein